MNVDIAIIGAGFSGLAASIRIKTKTEKTFHIFERADSLGGTWRDNIYPGCSCDIPSVLYSFSFDLNIKWTRIYPQQEEILSYLKEVSDKHALEPHISYNTEISETHFDKETGLWSLYDGDGKLCCQSRLLVAATGPLNKVKLPDICGIEEFAGKYWHSSQWNDNIPLDGKKVSVIGTGASAIQLVPQIASKVAKLYLFQRTPPWIIRKPDRKLTALEYFLNKYLPVHLRIRRYFVYLKHEIQVGNFLGNKLIQRTARWRGMSQLRKQVKDPVLRKKLTPDYSIGCKRVLLSNDYYPALQRSNVTLITDKIERITAEGPATKEQGIHASDVIIYCTGFDVADNYEEVKYYGTNGNELNQEWSENSTQTLLGITVHNYPNLILLAGPNTGLGHNSLLVMIEAQIDYMLSYLDTLDKEKLKYLDVHPEAQEKFQKTIQEKLSTTVWTSGCTSWYQTRDGYNNTIWPDTTIAYLRQTRSVKREDYSSVE